MVRVNYIKEPEILCLTCGGHAGYAEYGQDIVCAALSILAYTTAQAIAAMQEQGMLVGNPVLKLEPGDICIRAMPKKEHYAAVESAFTYALIGYRLMEKTYPQNVRLKLFGSDD